MNKELKFDHFKNINELLQHIDIWYKEDDIDYTRWFHLEDLKKVKDYITNLQQENKQLKEEIKKYINSNDFVYDELYKKRERIEKILGDKEQEEYTLTKDENGTTQINGEWYRVDKK